MLPDNFTEEDARVLVVQSGIMSRQRLDDLLSLPPDQQKAELEEIQLETQARPTDFGEVATATLGVMLKLVGVAGGIESGVSIVTGVPSLVSGVKSL